MKALTKEKEGIRSTNKEYDKQELDAPPPPPFQHHHPTATLQ